MQVTKETSLQGTRTHPMGKEDQNKLTIEKKSLNR